MAHFKYIYMHIYIYKNFTNKMLKQIVVFKKCKTVFSGDMQN